LPHSSLLNSVDRHTITLGLANTYQSLYKRAYNQLSISIDSASQANSLNTAQEYAQAALASYQSVADSQSADRIRAQLNTLQILLHLKKSNSSPLNSIYQQSQNLIGSYLNNLIAADFSQFPENESINLQLKLSHLLAEANLYKIPSSENNLSLAYETTRAALYQAEAFGDKRLVSQAYGIFGKLYLQSDQLDDATQVFTKALKLAQTVQDDHLAYQWSWQIAQIHQQRGERTQAIATYSSTLQHLDKVRTLLISSNADLQFNFNESVEPVYHSYLQLLLSSPNPDLQLVITTHQQLQVAELENYLKCGKLVTQSIKQQSSYSAQIHIFELNGQVEVIAKTQDGIVRHQPDSSVVQEELSRLLNFLHSDSFKEISEAHFRRNVQVLYEQIIDPLKDHLPPTGDLLFVLDSNFQNIPLSMLHDGQKYLIERYSVTNALNTQLQQVQPQSLEELNVLFAGLSEDSPSFTTPDVPLNLEALPEVEDELAGVKEASNKTISLLNNEFTTNRLQSKLQGDTPIVHLASHGQFSSNPEQTMILAFDAPIKANDFHDLISQKSELGQASIELLILSACQTAKGDRKSALGIAGLAVQAGSRNTLASLWLAESDATSKLISTFYEGLDNNLPKAKALQQAQIRLLDSEEFWHPYFWGNFVLVGS
ncbi:CHAT domain-containing protein, partial [Acaryochloris marina NIES-2412]|uniref:CHAT domain-containing protein n=1 Tax=Acaryochloris marina TaxID=155978 RepID=UPI0040597146